MAEEKKKGSRVLFQVAGIILVFAAAAGLFMLLKSMKKEPEKKERLLVIPLLDACAADVENVQMTVTGYGTVRARAEVQVVPQVSGRAEFVNSNFINGGFFRAGEALVRIESADYELAAERAQAAVAQAQVLLDQERAEADVAKQEWRRLHPDEEPTSALVLRTPQIANAKAQLLAAEAQLASARLDLKRTEISMLFDGRVVSGSIDEGQFLVAGQPIGAVYRTDVVEISVPLEDRELEWFDLSGTVAVDVSAQFAGRRYVWRGLAVRTEGEIDPTSRMVHVVVQVRNPFKTTDERPALVPGMFVQTDIRGRKIDSLVRIPRYALRNGREVWVAKNERLTIVPVDVIRLDKEFAYIVSGLNEGDIVITSPLEMVVDGMRVRIELSDKPCGGKDGTDG